jgi:hypothetical protein
MIIALVRNITLWNFFTRILHVMEIVGFQRTVVCVETPPRLETLTFALVCFVIARLNRLDSFRYILHSCSLLLFTM